MATLGCRQLEWSIVRQFVHNAKRILMFARGPYLYTIEETYENFKLIEVFASTGDLIRDVFPIEKYGYAVAVSNNHLAFINLKLIQNGGRVSASNIISTVTRLTIIEADGVVTENILKIKPVGVDLQVASREKKFYLRQGEKFTFFLYRAPVICLGTSKGDIHASVNFCGSNSIINTKINSPILQITPAAERQNLIIFQNGTLMMKRVTLTNQNGNDDEVLKGRFTTLSVNTFTIAKKPLHFEMILAGDRDGNIYAFKITNENKLVILNKHTLLNQSRISFIHSSNQQTIIYGTSCGEIEFLSNGFHLHNLWNKVANAGLNDAYNLRHFFKNLDAKALCKKDELLATLLEANNNSGKRLRFSFTLADTKKVEKIQINVDKKLTIIQIIPMPRTVLVQYKERRVELFKLETKSSWKLVEFEVDTGKRITAAAISGINNNVLFIFCQNYRRIQKEIRKFSLGIGLLDGGFEFYFAQQYKPRQFNLISCRTAFNLRGGYAVSMLDSPIDSSIQNQNSHFFCYTFMLASNGRLFRLVSIANLEDRSIRTSTDSEVCLRRYFKRGHSILELQKNQIIAYGFIQKRLVGCLIAENPEWIGQAISVATRGPKSPIVVKRFDEYNVSVIYRDPGADKITQGTYLLHSTFINMPVQHTGIITNYSGRLVSVPDMLPNEVVTCFISGDSEGNLCSWLVQKTKYYQIQHWKLNGAITDIVAIDRGFMVTTSKGEITTCRISEVAAELIARIPFKFENKIDKTVFMKVTQGQAKSHIHALLCLSDGSIWKVDIERPFANNSIDITNRRLVARFPTRIKSCVMQASAGKYNIIVLGKDDVLRKAELIRGQQNLSEMSHRLSYYSEYSFDETGVATLTGDHSGQCILTLYDQGNYTYFHIDNYHTHEIIDAKVLRLPGESIFWMATLDISGICPRDDLRALEVDDKQICMVDSEKNLIYFMRKILPIKNLFGIDVETVDEIFYQKKMVLFQLAVDDRIFIFDFILLDSRINESLREAFFQKLIQGDGLKLGFDFGNDLLSISQKYQTKYKEQNKNCLDLKDLIQNILEKHPDFLGEMSEEEVMKAQSLNDASKRILGKPLNKSMQQSNWAARPLKKEQIIYAATDAEILIQLYKGIKAKALEKDIDLAPFEAMSMIDSIKNEKEKIKKKKIEDMSWSEIVDTLNGPKLDMTEFTSHPQDFKFAMAQHLDLLGKNLRRCGFDVMLCSQGMPSLEKVAESEKTRILCCSGKAVDQMKTKYPKRVWEFGTTLDFVLLTKNAIQKAKVKLNKEDIFTRCVECNQVGFLMAPMPVIQALHRRHVVFLSDIYSDEIFDVKVWKEKLKGLSQEEYGDATCLVEDGDESFRVRIKNGRIDILSNEVLEKEKTVRTSIKNIPDNALIAGRIFYICSHCGKIYYDKDSSS